MERRVHAFMHARVTRVSKNGHARAQCWEGKELHLDGDWSLAEPKSVVVFVHARDGFC